MLSIVTVKGRIDEGSFGVDQFSDRFDNSFKISPVHEIQFLQDPSACFHLLLHMQVSDIGNFSVAAFCLVHAVFPYPSGYFFLWSTIIMHRLDSGAL